MRKFHLLTGTVLCCVAMAGQAADGPGWSYGQAAYWRADSGDQDTDAVAIQGSLAFAEVWHGQLQYFSGEDANDDFDGFVINAGAHPELSADTDLVAEFLIFDASFDDALPGGGDADCDGFGARTGLRSMQFDDRLELNAFATWVDASCDTSGGDADSTEVVAQFGGQYFWSPELSTGLLFTVGDSILEGDTLEFNVRYNFADLF